MENVNKTEVWKQVKGYEGLYEVSNLGRVRSVDRIINNRLFKGQILNPRYKENKEGNYLTVNLKFHNIGHTKFVHKLVAEAFLENDNSKLQVNHKNEIKTDNRVENLEWVSAKENCNYGSRNKRITETRIKIGYVNPHRVGLTKEEYRRVYRYEK